MLSFSQKSLFKFPKVSPKYCWHWFGSSYILAFTLISSSSTTSWYHKFPTNTMLTIPKKFTYSKFDQCFPHPRQDVDETLHELWRQACLSKDSSQTSSKPGPLGNSDLGHTWHPTVSFSELGPETSCLFRYGTFLQLMSACKGVSVDIDLLCQTQELYSWNYKLQLLNQYISLRFHMSPLGKTGVYWFKFRIWTLTYSCSLF